MNGLGDRASTITMVMEWQPEDEPAEPAAIPIEEAPGRRSDGVEASLDELAAIVRTRVTVVVRPPVSPDPPEEMIGEPLFRPGPRLAGFGERRSPFVRRNRVAAWRSPTVHGLFISPRHDRRGMSQGQP